MTDTEALREASRRLWAAVEASAHPSAALTVQLDAMAETFDAWADDPADKPLRTDMANIARALIGAGS